MEKRIGPMQMLVSIVERGKGMELIERLGQFHVVCHELTWGTGTLSSHLLDTLGFETAERDIVISLAPRDTVRRVMGYLKDDDRSKLGMRGIACSVPITGMNAILAAGLSAADIDEDGKETTGMEQTNRHSLILVVVNRGFTDEVMNTARAAGAKGGTVIRARWIGAQTVEQIAGITLQAEKEVLAIVAPDGERNAIMEGVNREHGLGSPAQASVISLPADAMARLD